MDDSRTDSLSPAIEIKTKHILFVCTGNTCRSPMAQGIAQKLIKELNDSELAIIADSAGVSGGDGFPASQEAVDVMNERGINLADHQSKPLTTELIERADLILTMTPAHAHAVLHMLPGAGHKVFLLDTHHPIGDPIGGPIEVYRDVADQLERLIKAMLEEIIT